MRSLRQLLVLLMIAAGPLAQAQLPGVQLPRTQAPGLPGVELPATVTDTLGNVENTAGTAVGGVATRTERLADLRRLKIDRLVRTQRATVERDPAGQPILRAEIVSFDPTAEVLDRARAEGFEVARERVLEGLGARVVVLRAPEGMTTRRALTRLRGLDPQGAYDYNHIYLDSGEVGAQSGVMVPTSGTVPDTRSASLVVGLVDGGVDASHPVFKDIAIHRYGCNDRSIPSPHGTAVASLLVGKSQPFSGAAPGAELYSADVYCGLGNGGAADAVVDGIAWLARNRVPVVNVSLVGPRNVLLENVVRMVIARGHIIVAAVGNDGPAAAPLYPASYPDVVGVTGVDSRRKVLLEACRGKQVKFAAPGSEMAAAGLSPTFAAVRGTSFAAPIVAGLLAAALREPDREAAAKAVDELGHAAIDLGSRGLDKVYGYGLVGDAVRTQASLALVTAPAPTAKH